MTSGRSPHHSVKVLPATPTSTSFPSNIRLVRDRTGPPLSVFNEGMPMYSYSSSTTPGSPNPFGGSIQFAKRKRNIFKGPMLSLAKDNRSEASRSAGHSRSASASGLGRGSGEITIQEVDEDAVEDEDNDVEEVDVFSPVIQRPGEKVEEIYEEDEGEENGLSPFSLPKAPMTPVR